MILRCVLIVRYEVNQDCSFIVSLDPLYLIESLQHERTRLHNKVHMC